MGNKSAPSAPDYAGAAVQEAEAGKEITRGQTYANRPQQNTPWGSSEWSTQRVIDPSTGKPVTKWQQDITLEPSQQRALDSQMNITEGRSHIAEGLIGRAGADLQNPMDYNGLPDAAGAPDVPNFYGTNLPQMGALPDPSAAPDNLPKGATAYEDLQSWTGLSDPKYDSNFADVQYNRQMSLMQPQMERDRSALDNRLRNQGLTPGSEAYDNAMKKMGDQQFEQKNRLSADSVRFGQDMRQDQFGRELATANYNTSLRGGQFGELERLQQQANAGTEAEFKRSMEVGRYQDSQRQQLSQEQLAFGGQGFQQQMQAAGFQNSLRQQALAEEAQRRGISINEMNALMTGQQVSMPGMPDFMSATKSQAPQFLQAATAQGNFDQQTYGTAVGFANSLASGYMARP